MMRGEPSGLFVGWSSTVVHTRVFTNVLNRFRVLFRSSRCSMAMPTPTPEPTEAARGGVPTRLFRNGNSQAVRIPRALAFENVDIEVEIERRGDELVIRPAVRKLKGLGADFRKLGRHFQHFRRYQPPQEPRAWDAISGTQDSTD